MNGIEAAVRVCIAPGCLLTQVVPLKAAIIYFCSPTWNMQKLIAIKGNAIHKVNSIYTYLP